MKTISMKKVLPSEIISRSDIARDAGYGDANLDTMPPTLLAYLRFCSKDQIDAFAWALPSKKLMIDYLQHPLGRRKLQPREVLVFEERAVAAIMVSLLITNPTRYYQALDFAKVRIPRLWPAVDAGFRRGMQAPSDPETP